MGGARKDDQHLPDWLPEDVRLYLDHVEGGHSIRALARERGCHASTVLRKVQRTETRRDDILVDRALARLGPLRRRRGTNSPDEVPMTLHPAFQGDDETMKPHVLRLLKALAGRGTVLAVTPQVAMAVAVREDEAGRPRQVAACPREVAEMMALRGWIAGEEGKRITRYRITQAGRQALGRMLAEAETARAGFAEAQAGFSLEGASGLADKAAPAAAAARPRRSAGAEAPVQVLARRRDREGRPYLTPELLDAAERLRMDFELAQMDGALGADWHAIMKGGPVYPQTGQGGDTRRLDAHRRLDAALRALGPDLGEVALKICCFEEGMEQIESELAMPARAGKYVLRIALNMLARHYEESGAAGQDLIY